MDRKENISKPSRKHHGEEAGAIAGEIVGAVVGSAAGPVGTVAGMVVGAVVGALTGHVLEDEERRNETHDQELDETIGVTGGDSGPPAWADAPSSRGQRAPTARSNGNLRKRRSQEMRRRALDASSLRGHPRRSAPYPGCGRSRRSCSMTSSSSL